MRINTTNLARESKSHEVKDFGAAIKDGSAIWRLDSGTSGEDDYLIYEDAMSERDIMDDVLAFFEMGVYGEGPDAKDPFDQEQPNPWTLTRLSRNDLERQFPVED